MKKIKYLATILSLLLAPLAMSGEISGKVVRVINGDTIKILIQETEFTVMLAGVNCPGLNLPAGIAARKFTSRLIGERVVTIRTQGMDPGGRTIGEILFQDGKDLGRELIKSGHCAAIQPNAEGEHGDFNSQRHGQR